MRRLGLLLSSLCLSVQCGAQPPSPTTPAAMGGVVVPSAESPAQARGLEDLRRKFGAEVSSQVPAVNTQIWRLRNDKIEELLKASRLQSPAEPIRLLDGDPRNLFASAPPALTATQQQRLSVLRGDPSVLGDPIVAQVRKDNLTQLSVASIEIAGYKPPESRRINLLPGIDIVATKESLAQVSRDQKVWTAEVNAIAEKGQAGFVSFHFRDGDVNGLMTIGSDVYTITSLGDGSLAVAKRRRDGAADHPQPPDEQNVTEDPDEGGAFDGDLPPIRVLVLYSKQVKELAPSIESDLLNLFALANSSFQRSGIGMVRLELAKAQESILVESSKIVDDTRRIKARINDPSDALFKLRRDVMANIVVFVGNYRYPDLPCGWSPMIKADVRNAISTVSYACLFTNFSLMHEIGHIFGARHDRTDDPDEPYRYGHGYISRDRWRTIMAYPSTCSAAGCPRIPFWATPSVQHPDDNTPLGTRDYEFDARVMKEQARRVSGLKTW